MRRLATLEPLAPQNLAMAGLDLEQGGKSEL
jgi:hypothetical protein